MRIALVCSSFLPVVGGVQWKVHFLATEYAARGHDVTVFAGRPSRSLASIELPVSPRYDLVRCGYPFPGMDRLGVSTLLFRRAIMRSHRNLRFDVLHCHHLGPPTRYGVSVKKCAAIPVVASSCGGDVMTLRAIGYGDRLEPRFDRMFRDNIRRVDVVVSICEHIKRELLEAGTTARIVDIPNGVAWDAFQVAPNPDEFRRFGVPNGSIVILSVGRHQPVKAYDLGLRAFARISDRFPRAIYLLVGDGVSRLAPLARELAVEDRVRFSEQLPNEELPMVFRSADVFFSPSLMEGFSQVNAQAMSSGLPSVITDAPGNRDSGLDGGALIARSAEPASMAEALARLLEDPELRRRIGFDAHRISKRFDWSLIAEEYLALFEEIVRPTESGGFRPHPTADGPGSPGSLGR